jgi:hypothetical protein
LSTPHTATTQAPAKLWDYRFGGTDEDEAIGVRQTRDGGCVLAGNSLSGLNGDKSQASHDYLDFWLVKLDAAGTKLWDQRYGGADPDKMYAFSPTSDGGYILGGMSMSGLSGAKPSRVRELPITGW